MNWLPVKWTLASELSKVLEHSHSYDFTPKEKELRICSENYLT